MTWAVLPGCEIITTWEAPSTSVVCAWIRWAMIRSTFVPIALSLPATMYQEGIVFHAGGPEGWPSVASAAGRWAVAMTSVTDRRRSAAKTSWKTLGLIVASGAGCPSGPGYVRTSSVGGPIIPPGASVSRPATVSPSSGAYAAT
jgi:hypothetical protein